MLKRAVKRQALMQRLRRNRIEERLRADLEATKRSLEAAESNFQNVVDAELIDCCIYEVNAAPGITRPPSIKYLRILSLL